MADIGNVHDNDPVSPIDDGSEQSQPQHESPNRSSPGPSNAERDKENAQPRGSRRLAIWWPEILAVILSIALLVAIVAVLASFHNKPLDSWNLPWHVRPNTVISVLMTLCRLAMLLAVGECIGQLKWVYFEQRPHTLSHFQVFDDASRGPWGALTLIYSVHWSALVASLGALVTVLALAMEPFAQQVLSYVPANQTQPSATIPNATLYDYGTGYEWFYTRHLASPPYGHEGTAAMTGAMLGSMSNASNAVTFNCESGNCTWDAFRSLGICSSCRNVTMEVEVANCTSHQTPLPGLDTYGSCNYRTPLNSSLSVQYSQSRRGQPGSSSASTFTLWNSTAPFDTLSIPFLPTLAYVSAIHLPSDWLLNGCPNIYGSGCSNNSIPRPLAYDCTMSWCLKTYSSSNVVNGTLSDKVAKETPLEFPFVPARDQPLRDADPYPESCLYDAETGYATASFEPLLVAGYVAPNGPANGRCDRFTRDRNNSTAAAWINVQDSEYISQRIASMFTQSLDTNTDSNLGQVLWSLNNGNFSKTMDNVATALTNAVRQSPNATALHGDVFTGITVIKVNWLWLIYPTALVTLAILFMVATFIFSAEKSDVVWKSSTLAVLFHGLQGWNENELQTRSLKQMGKTSRDMSARLAEDDQGKLCLLKH